MQVNTYYDSEVTRKMVGDNLHRDFIGGMWDEIGSLQVEFLIDQGLKPEMKFLDIGCGCLRAGIHLVRYLEPNHYYGVDINESLLDAGYDVELQKLQLQEKLPRSNLLYDAHFCASRLNTMFDMAIAQSVFSHLPLNHIRICLIEMAKCMKPGAVLFATFFEIPTQHPIEKTFVHDPGGVETFADLDPYHYHLNDFHWVIQGLPWEIKYIGVWEHPRGQHMLAFIKI